VDLLRDLEKITRGKGRRFQLRAINEEEKECYKFINSGQTALMSVELNGVETAAIIYTLSADDGKEEIYPVAVLVNDAIFEMIKPPEEVEDGNGRLSG